MKIMCQIVFSFSNFTSPLVFFFTLFVRYYCSQEAGFQRSAIMIFITFSQPLNTTRAMTKSAAAAARFEPITCRLRRRRINLAQNSGSDQTYQHIVVLRAEKYAKTRVKINHFHSILARFWAPLWRRRRRRRDEWKVRYCCAQVRDLHALFLAINCTGL